MLPTAYHQPLTAALIACMIGVLAWGRYGTDLVFMGALTALVVAGIVDPGAAVSGFANPGVVTVALLYVVAAGMKETGAASLLATRFLGSTRGTAAAQARLIVPVAGMSAFVNNTPIVATFLPVLSGVARRNGLAVSRLFMPLSFASILGGACTLIGTSTNVLVAQLLRAHSADAPDAPEFGMFTVAKVGLPIALVGAAYMLVFGRKLLPDRRKTDHEAGATRQYYAAVRVAPDAPIIGKTLEAAGLRHLEGLFLSRIDRGDDAIVAVEPTEVIREGDVLTFVGDLESIVDLQQTRGLIPVAEEQGAASSRHRLRNVEVVISPTSQLVGLTIRDAGFRTNYGAVVVAVNRLGQRLPGKIGDITLQPGDTLLLEAEPGFEKRYRRSREFLLVSERTEAAAPRHEHAWIAMALLGGMVVAITLGVAPLTAALVGAGAMIVTRCCTGPQARAAVDFQVLVTIGAAFGVGTAIAETNLADTIAGFIVNVAQPLGPPALLASMYALTLVFTMTMTNNAAAVLMFPVAMSVADDQSLNALPFAIVIAIAASCEFSTPIGYQTNLMIMGPGGYKWIDYLRFGGPLTLLAAIIAVVLTPLVFSLK